MADHHSMLDAIGNTPLIELRRIVPKGSARIVAKLESANPTGSMKDRVARAIVQGAMSRGEVDDIQTVSTAEAKAMARRLAEEEAIFAGTSSGANIVAALRVAAKLGEGATVATIIADSGLRYLSTDVFRRADAVASS